MPISWNEIKSRSIAFANEWKSDTKENAEAKSFWDGFFNVFGISRRRVASFEEPVKKLGNRQGFIDLFWKGNMIVEHKSRGLDLEKAYHQAIDYFPGLKEEELPKYILVSDFERFRLYNLDENLQHEFLMSEFHNRVKLFGFIAGYQKTTFHDELPINNRAAERIGKLHDRLKSIGYEGHDLEVYLVRILFLLFADDTGIFEKGIFWDFIENHTVKDGSNVAPKLAQLFQVLNTPPEKRLKNLDESFTQFPYINGNLFEESISIASFDSEMRQILLENCSFNWSLISPAIFGSLFQSIMDKMERRNLGAHYTSEKNIMKLIKPLFLDELWEKFHKIKNNPKQLAEFHKSIGELRFLDPACGSGNFLIIAYRELRLLELEILHYTYKNQQITNIENVIWIDIDHFYGIEIDEWAARIAEVAMWLIDHQMNMKISDEFGNYFARIPLKKSANIRHGNALEIDWKTLLHPAKHYDIVAQHTNIFVEEPQVEYKTLHLKTQTFDIHPNTTPELQNQYNFDYILGNPPFIGKKEQNKNQKADFLKAANEIKGSGVLDYVAGWYLKAAKYIQNTNVKVAFVSTNSISQGEQVGILWNELYNRYKIKIHFAHRTFKWSNEAKGNAAVHVVIIGFASFDTNEKYLFDYEDIKGEPEKIKVSNINPYLVEGKDVVVLKKTNSICNAPKLIYGSMPIDEGILILSDKEKEEFIEKEPLAQKFIRQYMGGYEFINNVKRWCLWLLDIQPHELRKLPLVYERVKRLQQYRNQSNRANTVKLAKTPHLFGEIRQPDSDYILIPKVSSENRKYIPISFISKEIIVSGTALFMPTNDMYFLGILMSEMHMIWIKYTCGRMKSDPVYSTSIVYNNFPFPKNLSDNQKEVVEKAAQLIIEARSKYPNSSLADLYDSVSMPPDLVKAHQQLDKAVDLCYRSQSFANERVRIEFLFDLYSQYVTPLLSQMEKNDKKKRRKKTV